MNQGKESFGRPDTGPSVTLHPYCAPALGNRTRAGCMPQEKESYDSGGTPPQRNSAAVMSRGMVMAESSVVTATMRVLNR